MVVVPVVALHQKAGSAVTASQGRPERESGCDLGGYDRADQDLGLARGNGGPGGGAVSAGGGGGGEAGGESGGDGGGGEGRCWWEARKDLCSD